MLLDGAAVIIAFMRSRFAAALLVLAWLLTGPYVLHLVRHGPLNYSLHVRMMVLPDGMFMVHMNRTTVHVLTD